MKKILILGSGTGGTIMANKLRKELSRDEWMITVVDRDKTHYYQPDSSLSLWSLQKVM